MLIKIYKIVNNINDEVYIGSTTQPLYRRWNDHKQRAKRITGTHHTSKILFDKYGIENCSIVLEHTEDVLDKEHCNKLEREWIDKYSGRCVNKYMPFRTNEERCEQRKAYPARIYDKDEYAKSELRKKRQLDVCCVCCKTKLKWGSLTEHLKICK